MTTENLFLWDKVCSTDPKFTKKFKRPGGFSGSAIDPMYQIRRATDMWGPIGDKWGFDVVEEKIVDLGQDDKLHYVYIMFWYHNKEGKRCQFQQVGQTMMIAKGRIAEEAPKMSLTDALTKALSWLGFSADIWLGEHDGNKYSAPTRAPQPKPKPPPEPEADQDTQVMILTKLIKDTKINVNTFLEYYKVSDITDMNDKALAHAIKTLRNRR